MTEHKLAALIGLIALLYLAWLVLGPKRKDPS